MTEISKLNHAYPEIKSSSTRNRSSVKDKEKFKTTLKNTKEKESEDKEKPEIIPLSHFFSPSLPAKELALEGEKKSLQEMEKKKEYHNLLAEEMLANSAKVATMQNLSESQQAQAVLKTDTALSVEVMDLFHEMVSHMTLMTVEDVSETTIYLNDPAFSSSVFYGAQIIISEYSTAPKIFNIELVGNSAAALRFSSHIKELQHSFKTGPFSFEVNRLEASILDEETSLFNRKERVSLDEEKEQEQ